MRPFQFQFQFQQQHTPSDTIYDDHRRNLPSNFGGEGRREEEGIMTFTAGQRQELERQTVIYKYMMASMPVPPQLLLPLNNSTSGNEEDQVLLGRRGSKNGAASRLEPLRYAMTTTTTTTTTTASNNREVKDRGGGVDREPWRCRRTDGKKWRCSRDVAPDHKYCERHSHKGRPSRSRKPVESTLTTTTATTATATAPSSTYCNPITLRSPAASFDALPHYNHFTPRYPDEWFMRKQQVSVGVPLCPQQQIHPDAADHRPDHTANSTSPSLSPLNDDDQSGSLLPRPFIDAWSLRDPDNDKDAPVNPPSAPTMITATSSPLHSILPLTLGIDHDINNSRDDHANDNNNNIDDQASIIRLSSHHHHHQQHQHQPLNWMNSWISSPPGGPLAEALCLGVGGPGTNSSDEQLLLSHHARTTSSTTSTSTTTGSKDFTC